jgi:arylsulfatase A-like enzyme
VGYRRAEEIRIEAIDWLRARGSHPFFLFLNFFDAHDPYLPVENFEHLFSSKPPEVEWIGFPDYYPDVLRGTRRPSPAELEYLKGQYDAELVYLDSELSQLLAYLKTTGLYDETLIIVVSDHGEEFMEHGLLLHSTSLYEPQVAVPLLIKPPSSFAAPFVGRHMQFVDLLPTIFDVLDLELTVPTQGSPWGAGRDFAISEAFCHALQFDWRCKELFAVRINDWKYLRSSDGTEKAYDLAVDPGERKNVIGEHLELETLARSLFEMYQAKFDSTSTTERENESTLEKLRALGYIK